MLTGPKATQKYDHNKIWPWYVRLYHQIDRWDLYPHNRQLCAFNACALNEGARKMHL
jgi:hypothetical protein